MLSIWTRLKFCRLVKGYSRNCVAKSLFEFRLIEKLDVFESFEGKEENAVDPFPYKTWFLRVCSTGLLKTLWEKENLLVSVSRV